MNVREMPFQDWLVVGGAALLIVGATVLILWPSGKHREKSNGGGCFIFMGAVIVVAFLLAWVYAKIKFG